MNLVQYISSKTIVLSAFLYVSANILLPVILNRVITRSLKKRKNEIVQKQQRLQSNYYYHCLFLSPLVECRTHIYQNLECGEQCSNVFLRRLRKFISSAKFSISICLYFLTLEQIHDELVEAYRKGIRIRVITDYTMFQIKPCKFRILKHKFGVPVKTPPQTSTETLMHHKFLLVDENKNAHAKLLVGSLNWTLQGVTKNYEFVFITNDGRMIQIFSQEFERLWEELGEISA